MGKGTSVERKKNFSPRRRWNDKTRVDLPPPLKVPRDMTERAWEESRRKNQGGQMIRQAISN